MDAIKHGLHWLAESKAPTRHRVLLALKLHGEAPAARLAAYLRMSAMGVRRHLYTLEREGLVAHRVVRNGPGRPRHHYYLTAQGHATFGQGYAPLAVELLSYLQELYGQEAVRLLFARRSQRRIAQAQRVLGDLPLPERGAILAELLTREGYLAEWQPEDNGCFLLCEHHCAIQEVAEAFPEACSSELAFLQALFPEATVTRIAHLREGDTFCAYCIRQESEGG